MATDLVSLPAGSSADREVLALALTGKPLDQAGDLTGSLELLGRWLAPLKQVEPKHDGQGTQRLMEKLRLIGAKIAPTMSEEQVNVWLTAMVVALSDLPARVSIKAAEEAMHVSMRFLNEAEGVIREKAEAITGRYHLARWRMERAARDRVHPEAPALPAPAPMTDEQLEHLPDELRRLGLAAGWIEEDETGKLTWKDQAHD